MTELHRDLVELHDIIKPLLPVVSAEIRNGFIFELKELSRKLQTQESDIYSLQREVDSLEDDLAYRVDPDEVEADYPDELEEMLAILSSVSSRGRLSVHQLEDLIWLHKQFMRNYRNTIL